MQETINAINSSSLSDEDKKEKRRQIKKSLEVHRGYFDEIKWMESCGSIAKVGYMTAEDEIVLRRRYGTYYNCILITRFNIATLFRCPPSS